MRSKGRALYLACLTDVLIYLVPNVFSSLFYVSFFSDFQ
jgi:hypothetical protein